MEPDPGSPPMKGRIGRGEGVGEMAPPSSLPSGQVQKHVMFVPDHHPMMGNHGGGGEIIDNYPSKRQRVSPSNILGPASPLPLNNNNNNNTREYGFEVVEEKNHNNNNTNSYDDSVNTSYNPNNNTNANYTNANYSNNTNIINTNADCGSINELQSIQYQHLDWSDKQIRMLTADGNANLYYDLAFCTFDKKELPHYHLKAGSTHPIFTEWSNTIENNYLICGAWTRSLCIGGWDHSSSSDEIVYNIQTPTLFVDIRIPKTRAKVLQLNNFVTSIKQLDDNALRLYARQHVFAGYTLLSWEESQQQQRQNQNNTDAGTETPAATSTVDGSDVDDGEQKATAVVVQSSQKINLASLESRGKDFSALMQQHRDEGSNGDVAITEANEVCTNNDTNSQPGTDEGQPHQQQESEGAAATTAQVSEEVKANKNENETTNTTATAIGNNNKVINQAASFRSVCTRHHCIDSNFIGHNEQKIPNKWWTEMSNDEEKCKVLSYSTDTNGQHYYTEMWERLESGDSDDVTLALRKKPSLDGPDGILVVVGDHFNYVFGRQMTGEEKNYPTASSLVDLIEKALKVGDRITAESYLSIDAGHGRISKGWLIDSAMQPWKEGTVLPGLQDITVLTGDNKDIHDFDSPLEACHVLWRGQEWEINHSSLTSSEQLKNLFTNGKVT